MLLARRCALLPRLRAAVRIAAARTWASRARFEREAVATYRRLAHDLALAGEDALSARAVEAAVAEARHVDICTEIALRLGASNCTHMPPSATSFCPAHIPVTQRALYELIQVGAVNETINACLLFLCLERAEAPWLRRALRELLRDEVEHSQLGWAAGRRASDLRVPWLRSSLYRMLAGARGELPHGPDLPDDELDRDPGWSFGTPGVGSRRTLFSTAVNEVVRPGWESLASRIDHPRGAARAGVTAL